MAALVCHGVEICLLLILAGAMPGKVALMGAEAEVFVLDFAKM